MTTPIKLETAAVAHALVEIDVLSEKQAKATIYLDGMEDPASFVTVTCGECWASGTEAVVSALESLLVVIRTESKKLGIPIRSTRIFDATKPRGDLS
jgi:hypothetical protein